MNNGCDCGKGKTYKVRMNCLVCDWCGRTRELAVPGATTYGRLCSGDRFYSGYDDKPILYTKGRESESNGGRFVRFAPGVPVVKKQED